MMIDISTPLTTIGSEHCRLNWFTQVLSRVSSFTFVTLSAT